MIPQVKRVYVPAILLVNPPGGTIHHFDGCWWIVHPDKGIAFYHFGRRIRAQCNSNLDVAMDLRRIYYPDLEIIHYDHIYLRERDGELLLPKGYQP
jgi:hypothetical protein